MAKFFIILALTSVATAIDSAYGGYGLGYGIGPRIGIGQGYGPVAGVGVKQVRSVGIGSGIGIGAYGGGLGMSKQIHSSVGSHIGSTLGMSKQIHSLGVSKQMHSLGVSKQIHSLGVSKQIHASPYLTGLQGIGSLGLGSLNNFAAFSAINRLSVPAISTIPGGYFGGVLGAYHQAIPATVTTSALHIPGAAVDAYKGYYAGYFPGSIGYGHSYRFFH